MRGRHTAELTHQLRGAIVSRLTRRERDFRALRVRLEAHDLRRRLAAIRGRLEGATTRLQSGITRRRERAQGRLAASVGRLESLSPLAVLGRGYAVCWNEDRTAIVRAADSVNAGDRVHVTLDAGELQCEVLTTHAERGRRA